MLPCYKEANAFQFECLKLKLKCVLVGGKIKHQIQCDLVGQLKEPGGQQMAPAAEFKFSRLCNYSIPRREYYRL